MQRVVVAEGEINHLVLGSDRELVEFIEEKVKGGDAAHNAEALKALLKGAPGAYRDAVLLNAGGALVVSRAACVLHLSKRETAKVCALLGIQPISTAQFLARDQVPAALGQLLAAKGEADLPRQPTEPAGLVPQHARMRMAA